MTDSVRVRYAPSPTGLPHVGNIRTALFNWLFARHHGGTFIVRIEDTDVARRVEGAVEAILDSLRWLGLDWDEGPEAGGNCGPYFQSQRLDLYRQAAERLVIEGNAYRCYCSPQRLEEMRAEQVHRKQPPGYDRRCRNLSGEERHGLEKQGIVPVIRFKVPTEGETRFNDLIRGEVVFANTTLDDFVLIKSDGYPTYHMANIVDDHEMRISHVLRADEWLASTPRHMLLYAAVGYQPPLFAHLPMILGPDRSKLSKRHGATALTEYRDAGYLPQAMMNFLALLGWSLDDHTELFSREELIKHFSLERIGKTGAIFNIDKLKWINGVYIRTLNKKQLVDQVIPFLERDLPPAIKRPLDKEHLAAIMPLIQERLATLEDAAALCDFFFLEMPDYDPRLLPGKKLDEETAGKALSAALEHLEDLPFDHDSLEKDFRALAETLGLKTGDFFGLIRVATTGRTAAPPLFQTMVVLGKEKCLKRIEGALVKLQELS
ncbi:MAG: glutamate--tRNA ligase [Chloroflexi bacterium]|nr:glutamate--tRNA ligase [Chloroflexota bacterium]